MENRLIIGDSSSIGKRHAVKLATEGDDVYGTYNRNPAPKGIAARAFGVLAEDFNPDFLPDRLDSMVYCPGSIELKPFYRLKEEQIIDDLKLQVLGAVSILQKVLPRLKAPDSASILFFSTVAVGKGFNFHSQVAISKGAIEGLTRSLATEFTPKNRVTAIAPSLTDTPLAAKLLSNEAKKSAYARHHPLKRIGSAQDIAEMAALLLSDKATWVTGQTISVDEGMSSITM